MNPRTTMILTVLAVIMTTQAYRSIRDARPSYVVGLERPLNFSIPAVQSVEILRGDEDRIEIQRQSSLHSSGQTSWNIVKPVADPGRYSAIEDLLLMLRDVESHGQGPSDLADCGLDDPQVSVRIGTGSRHHDLLLGKDHPAFDRVYALIDGESVLVDRQLREVLMRFRLSELREDAVVGLSPDRIRSVKLSRPGEDELVLKRKGAFWSMEQPIRADANSSAVESWLQKLSQWAVVDYIDDPREIADALQTPRAILTIETADAEKTIKVGPVFAVDGQSSAVLVEASDRASALIVAGTPAENLVTRKATGLVSPYLIRFDDPRIDALTLTRGLYGPVKLERQESGGWSLNWAGEQGQRLADADLVESLLTDLGTLKSETWQNVDRSALQKWGFDQPLLEILLETPGGESEQLIIGSPVPDRPGLNYVWNPRRESCALAPVPELPLMRRAPFSMRSLLVASPAAEVSRFRLSAVGIGQIEVVRPNRSWRVVQGSGGAAGADLFQMELNAISERMLKMTMGRWLDPGAEAPHQNRHRLRIDWLSADSSQTPLMTLYLGGRTAEGWVRARFADSDWAFALAPESGINLETLGIEVLRQLTTGAREDR